MSTFGNEIENDLADKKNNTKKKLLIAVNLVTDGLGDVYHLFDIIQHEKEFMANYEKDVLLTTNYNLQIRESK